MKERIYRGEVNAGTPVRFSVTVYIGPAWETGERRPLTHHRRHSPDGFAWGYGGSGPSELARCLLIDALGDEALCPDCGGIGSLVWDQEISDFVRPSGDGEVAAAHSVDPDAVMLCDRCSDGIRELPYHDFKVDVVAKLPMDRDFTLSRTTILEWLTAHDPLSAGLAERVREQAGV